MAKTTFTINYSAISAKYRTVEKRMLAWDMLVVMQKMGLLPGVSFSHSTEQPLVIKFEQLKSKRSRRA